MSIPITKYMGHTISRGGHERPIEDNNRSLAFMVRKRHKLLDLFHGSRLVYSKGAR